MSGLTRTDLTTIDKVRLLAGAVARENEYGAVSELARDYSISRPTVYSMIDEGLRVLGAHFSPPCSSSVLATVKVDELLLKRTVVALRVVGHNSVRSIEDLLPIIFPGLSVSYGKIHEWLMEAEERAANLNKQADLSTIKAGAVDEMFSQRQPVLAGVDLDSGYLFGLEKRESRSAEDWAEFLKGCQAQGLALEVTVQDAAPGIAAGVRSVYPEAEQRDDCFHAHYRMNKELRRLEAKAYGAIAAEVQLEREIVRTKRSSKGTRKMVQKLHGKLTWVKQRCLKALEKHDHFAEAVELAREGMEVVDVETGTIRTPKEMKQMLDDAVSKMKMVDDSRCRKTGRYLTNRAPGLVLYAASLRDELGELAQEYGETAVRLGSVMIRLTADLARARQPWLRGDRLRHLAGAYALLGHHAGAERRDEAIEAVKDCFQRRHRASSAIEGFNAALRPHLYIQKSANQGFLDLFRAYYNLRQRRWGRHKGTSAHEAMTGTRVHDWLDVLGYRHEVDEVDKAA